MTFELNRDRFFPTVRDTLFGGSWTQGQFAGTEAIVTGWQKFFVPPSRMPTLAYMLATAYHETDRKMLPVREYGFGRGRPYGKPVDGMIYYGRGLIQLTWNYNYKKADAYLHSRGLLLPDEDLVTNPDLALRPDLAGYIMFAGMAEGWFSAHGTTLANYFTDNMTDFVHARALINGNDRAELIAGYAQHFLTALS